MDNRSDGAGLRILIVEDRADNAVSMALLLGMYGHTVEIAGDGPTALEKARSNDPDVVLLDLGLPGMSGYEVAQQLSSHRPGKSPFLVAVTGYGREEDRRHAAETGIDLHLLKPIDPEALRVVLEKFQRAIS